MVTVAFAGEGMSESGVGEKIGAGENSVLVVDAYLKRSAAVVCECRVGYREISRENRLPETDRHMAIGPFEGPALGWRQVFRENKIRRVIVDDSHGEDIFLVKGWRSMLEVYQGSIVFGRIVNVIRSLRVVYFNVLDFRRRGDVLLVDLSKHVEVLNCTVNERYQ